MSGKLLTNLDHSWKIVKDLRACVVPQFSSGKKKCAGKSKSFIVKSGKLETIFHSPQESAKELTTFTSKSGKLLTTLTVMSGKEVTSFTCHCEKKKKRKERERGL